MTPEQQAEAVAILKVFADAAEYWEPIYDDAEIMKNQPQFTEAWRRKHGRRPIPQFVLGDLRKARRFLEGIEGGSE